MTNTDQLKVGDRVMLLPISGLGFRNIAPFSIGEYLKPINFGKIYIRFSNGKEMKMPKKHVQPLPTKFDGWEEE